MMPPLTKGPPRKLETTTRTNRHADAIMALAGAALPAVGSGMDQQQPVMIKRVKITGNAAGGGKYTGRLLNPPIVAIPPTGDLTAAELGDDPGADNVLIVNAQEVGQSTHDLTAGTPKVTTFIGMFYAFTTDEKMVVMINGIDLDNDCPT